MQNVTNVTLKRISTRETQENGYKTVIFLYSYTHAKEAVEVVSGGSLWRMKQKPANQPQQITNQPQRLRNRYYLCEWLRLEAEEQLPASDHSKGKFNYMLYKTSLLVESRLVFSIFVP